MAKIEITVAGKVFYGESWKALALAIAADAEAVKAIPGAAAPVVDEVIVHGAAERGVPVFVLRADHPRDIRGLIAAAVELNECRAVEAQAAIREFELWEAACRL